MRPNRVSWTLFSTAALAATLCTGAARAALTDLHPSGYETSHAVAINSSGRIALKAWSHTGGYQQDAFYRDPGGTPVKLPAPDLGNVLQSNGVTGINDTGVIIGYSDATVVKRNKVYIATFTLTNPTSQPATDVVLTTASLGGDPAFGATKVGVVQAGASTPVTLQFKDGLSGQVSLVLEGTCSLACFSRTQPIVLP